MNLNQLEYLRAIERMGNIKHAAESIGITPQAISSAIATLERELGLHLIEKEGREVHLTVQGHRFVQESQSVLDGIEKLRSFAAQDLDGISPDGHFRLYVPDLKSRGALFEDDSYERFVADHPAIHLDVWHQSNASCLDSLLLNISDAAVSFEKRLDDYIQYREIGSIELRVATVQDGQLPAFIDIANFVNRRIAVPINLVTCLNALASTGDIELPSLKFRDISFTDEQAQLDFLKSGGLELVTPGSVLAKHNDIVRELPINALRHPKLTVYYCFRNGEWSNRHQAVYWHLLKTLLH